MSEPSRLSSRFRHVVFPADPRGRKRIVNFAAPEELPLPPTHASPVLGPDSASFLHWLFARAGLEARLYRTETLQRRLPACLRMLRVRTPTQARHLLEGNAALIPTALSAMLVGVTSFFRDPGLFDFLGREVLPELARGRAGLHVWSAGCSDGAELYSVALLLAEMGLLGGSYLLGTDCRPDALARARAGVFEAAALKNLPLPLRERYFTAAEGRWQVAAALRTSLRWRGADVLKTQEPGVWDMILCRNTIMYMRTDATQLLWERFETGLRPGGVLVLGKAERPLGGKRLSILARCVYRRKRG